MKKIIDLITKQNKEYTKKYTDKNYQYLIDVYNDNIDPKLYLLTSPYLGIISQYLPTNINLEIKENEVIRDLVNRVIHKAKNVIDYNIWTGKNEILKDLTLEIAKFTDKKLLNYFDTIKIIEAIQESKEPSRITNIKILDNYFIIFEIANSIDKDKPSQYVFFNLTR